MILVVEDSRDDALLISEGLKGSGVIESVFVAGSGEEAIQYLSGQGYFSDRGAFPLPRLVLLDLALPGVSGLEVLRWVRGQPKLLGLPVVVLSGRGMQEEAEAVWGAGANSFVVKGVTFLKDMGELARYWLKVCELPTCVVAGSAARRCGAEGGVSRRVGL